MSDIKLYQGDCLEVMKNIPDKSVDMVLCDLPYQKTHNSWDIMIPFESLWQQYERIITDTATICLFGQDTFTAKLMLSNEKLHRYNIIWDKVLTGGFLNAKKQPLRSHEDICIFYKKFGTYNPQMIVGEKCHSKGKAVGQHSDNLTNNNYGGYTVVECVNDMKYPKSIISFSKPHPSIAVHPTQKPVDLLQYLIKTYTNEGDTVLDNCMGSGSTGVAAKILNRNFIGIELDENYFKIAEERINAAVVGEPGTSQIKKVEPEHKVHKFF